MAAPVKLAEESSGPVPPCFDLVPEDARVEEGDVAKFVAKVSGNPVPGVTWWHNDSIVFEVGICSFFLDISTSFYLELV